MRLVGARHSYGVVFTTMIAQIWFLNGGSQHGGQQKFEQYSEPYFPIFRSFSFAWVASFDRGCSRTTLLKYSLALALFFSFR